MFSARYGSSVLVEESDLKSYARIRNAALAGFAANGVAATSVRDIATAAGVSPGLVQHHFKTKDALREAVNEYVLRIAIESFRDLAADATGMDWVDALADQVTSVIREHHVALRYVARSMVEGDEAALKIFEGFVEVADAQVERLVDEGLLREDADLRWVVLQSLVLNLGLILLEPAVSQQLPSPYFSEPELRRYHEATVDLFVKGVFRPARARAGAAAKRKAKPTAKPTGTG